MKNTLKNILLLTISLAVKPLHCEDPENLTETLATLSLDAPAQPEKSISEDRIPKLINLCSQYIAVCDKLPKLEKEGAKKIAVLFTLLCKAGLLNQALLLANTLDALDKKDVAEKFLELNKSTLRLLERSTEEPFKSARSITGYITKRNELFYNELYAMFQRCKTTNTSISPNEKYLCTTTFGNHGQKSIDIWNLENGQLLCSHSTVKPSFRACFYDDETVLTLHSGEDIQAWSFQYSLEDMMQQVAAQTQQTSTIKLK